MSQMNEINPGVIDGMTMSEIQDTYPEEYERSLREPYSHRYPRAESYHDLSVRLEPVILELERGGFLPPPPPPHLLRPMLTTIGTDRRDAVIIAHASVLRCLLAYLTGLPPHRLASQQIRRGDVVEIVPGSYGIQSRTHTFWEPPLDISQAITEKCVVTHYLSDKTWADWGFSE
jgi:6-phosphofructo-2-kinase/fructose-2,6-biphosphatase 4